MEILRSSAKVVRFYQPKQWRDLSHNKRLDRHGNLKCFASIYCCLSPRPWYLSMLLSSRANSSQYVLILSPRFSSSAEVHFAFSDKVNFLSNLTTNDKKIAAAEPLCFVTCESLLSVHSIYCCCDNNDGRSYNVCSGTSYIIPWMCSKKQGRQYTYNITFKRFHITIVAAWKQWVLHILSVCVCL